MNEVINTIVTIIEAYFETILPEATAISFVDIWQYTSEALIDLANTYIAVIFA